VHDAHGVQLLEIVDRKRADAAAAVDFGLDEPSRWSIRTASRSGPRLTPSLVASCTCESDSPGGRAPLRIDSRRLV
jgi:hypothetical protein